MNTSLTQYLDTIKERLEKATPERFIPKYQETARLCCESCQDTSFKQECVVAFSHGVLTLLNTVRPDIEMLIKIARRQAETLRDYSDSPMGSAPALVAQENVQKIIEGRG